VKDVKQLMKGAKALFKEANILPVIKDTKRLLTVVLKELKGVLKYAK
jgi:hypothetical protein